MFLRPQCPITRTHLRQRETESYNILNCSNNKTIYGNGLFFVIINKLLRDKVIAIWNSTQCIYQNQHHRRKQQQLTCRQPELSTSMVKVPRNYHLVKSPGEEGRGRGVQAGSWSNQHSRLSYHKARPATAGADWNCWVCASVCPGHYTQTQRLRKRQNWICLARIEAACTWAIAVCVLSLQKPSGYL